MLLDAGWMQTERRWGVSDTSAEKDDFGMPELMNASIIFGLKAQGHIPTIRKMLAEGKTWEEIGEKIGWCPKTAKEHWELIESKGGGV